MLSKETVGTLENLDINVILDRKPIQFDVPGIASNFRGKSILITGAGGSIGSSLSELLISFKPKKLILLDHHENSLYLLRQRLNQVQHGDKMHFVLADVRDEYKIARVFRQFSPEIVFHMAAYKHVPMGEENPDEVVSTNVFGSLNMVEQALRAGVEMFVFPSTDKAVNPPSIYGATKRIVELLLREKKRNPGNSGISTVRLVNTIGAQGGVIRVFAEQILSGKPVTLTHEAMIRYWISMKEATLFIAHAACVPETEGILLLDMGEPLGLRAVAERLWKYLGSPNQGLDLKFIGMRPGERLEEELHYSFESVRQTTYPGILEILDPLEGGSSPVKILDKLPALKEALLGGSDEHLRRELFKLVPMP